MGRPITALLAISLLVIGLNAVAQTVQQPNDISKPGNADSKTRQTPQERQRYLERYFVEMCQKENRCDGDCKEVYDGIDAKQNLTLRCP
jgi:hypothetical protein